MKIRLQISYDGTGYAGWQRQADDSPDPRPTLQATLEEALSKIFNYEIKAQASGRTDAGVHAEAQTVHFVVPENESGEPLKDPRTMKLLRSLNGLTPEAMTIHRAWIAPEDFHAIRSAESKTYRYVIDNSTYQNALRARFTTWVNKPLDLQKLNGFAEVLLGEHDFKSFQTGGTEVKSTVRTVSSARWTETDKNLLELRITGNGFLKQMIRNIVGTSIYLHQNGFGPAEMKRILEAKDRQSAKATARPEGLFLVGVEYPASIEDACQVLESSP